MSVSLGKVCALPFHFRGYERTDCVWINGVEACEVCGRTLLRGRSIRAAVSRAAGSWEFDDMGINAHPSLPAYVGAVEVCSCTLNDIGSRCQKVTMSSALLHTIEVLVSLLVVCKA